MNDTDAYGNTHRKVTTRDEAIEMVNHEYPIAVDEFKDRLDVEIITWLRDAIVYGYENNLIDAVEYGVVRMHHACNAATLAGNVPTANDNADDRYIAFRVEDGCYAFMQAGADDMADIVETAKVLSIMMPIGRGARDPESPMNRIARRGR